MKKWTIEGCTCNKYPKRYLEAHTPFAWMQESEKCSFWHLSVGDARRHTSSGSGVESQLVALNKRLGCLLPWFVSGSSPSQIFSTVPPVCILFNSTHLSLPGSLGFWDLTLSCPFLCEGDISTWFQKLWQFIASISQSIETVGRSAFPTCSRQKPILEMAKSLLSLLSLLSSEFFSWDWLQLCLTIAPHGILPLTLPPISNTFFSPLVQLTAGCFWNRINNTCCYLASARSHTYVMCVV